MTDDPVLDYLRARGRAEVPPDLTQSVMAELDDARERPGRFGLPIAASLAVAAAVLAVVVGLSLSGNPRLGGEDAVPDCEDDPIGLLRYAADQLAQSEGYRWTEEEEVWDFDPAVALDAENLQYAWVGYIADGVYVAPGRMHARVTSTDRTWPPTGPFGFPEVIHIEGRTWALVDAAGELEGPDWHEVPGGSRPNRILELYEWTDRLEEADLPPADLSWELPGEGGCEIVRAIEPHALPSGVDLIPIVFAARVDADGRLVAGAWERVRADRPDGERSGDSRLRFSVTYKVADASEIVPPDGPVATPAPSPS